MRVGRIVSPQVTVFKSKVAEIRDIHACSSWSATRIATRVFFMTFLITAAGIKGEGFDNFVGDAATLTWIPATLYGYFKKSLRTTSLASFAVRFLLGFQIGWDFSLPFSVLNEAAGVKWGRRALHKNLSGYTDDLQKTFSAKEITPEIITQELLSLHWRFFGRSGARLANHLILDTLGSTDLGKFNAVLALLVESRKGRAVLRRAHYA